MNQKKNSVRRHLGALKARWHVIDPPTWCGAATTTFMRGTWRPPSFVEKLLSGTQDQGDRGLGVLGKDLIVEKQYSLRVLQQRGCRCAFVANRTTG